MKIWHSFIVIIFILLAFACAQQETADSQPQIKSNVDTSNTKQFLEMTNPHEDKIDGYTFKYGYLHYDEDKYGFSNPGFLKVFKDDQLIFSDPFEGEGSVYIESLGHHNLNGDKIVFRLNYGTEACDYAFTSKYYVIDKNEIKFLKSCFTITGGDQYSSRMYEHIFPTDSAGQANSILIVEGQIFHEKDQPDQFDTSYIKFENGKYTITKPTDNLSKVK